MKFKTFKWGPTRIFAVEVTFAEIREQFLVWKLKREQRKRKRK